jgi:hypothetical protein
MAPEVQAILERHYGYAKGALKKLGPPTPAERALAKRAGYPVNAKLSISHDDCLKRLRKAAARIKPEQATAAFVAGVGGSALGGRQVLVSYAHARHLPAHEADPTPGYQNCRTCGIDRKEQLDPTDRILRVALGAVWNEGEGNYFLDLEEFLRGTPPEPTKADREVLRAVLRTASKVAPDCTPGGLEKELAAKKVIPSSEKYARYGILEALAMVGVLPNRLIAPEWDRLVTRTELWEASHRVKGAPRSDIILPFGGWRGELGVDWKRAKTLFGIGP